MTTADAASRSASTRGSLLARHPLIFFFLFAYAFSWLGWSPWFLSEAGLGLLPYDGDELSILWNVVGLVLGPTLSAITMTGATEGRVGVRHLLRRIVLWRVGLGWYLFVLLGIPTIMLLSTIILPGALTSFEAAALPSVLTYYVPFFFLLSVLGGPLFEEIGWRGFALPRLQQLHGPLFGSLILGILWALWHLPLFLVSSWDTPHGSVLDLVLFVIVAIAITIVFTWVFNNTKGSVLLVILAHGSINMAAASLYDLFPAPVVTDSATSFVIGFGVVALVVVAMTRGRLSYQQEDPDTASAPA
jgi:membrane protease YdiL (CAAX protease family)